MPKSKLSAAQRRDYTALLQAGAQFGVLDAFRPNEGGQEGILKSKKHELFLFGANSSGKTYLGLVWDAYNIVPEKDKQTKKLTGYTINPYRRTRINRLGRLGWISSYSQDVQRDNIDPLVDRILLPHADDARKEKNVYHSMAFPSGKINFKWQTQETEAQRGAKVDFVHADEPHKKAIYNEFLARIVARKGIVLSTLTPVIDAKSSALRAAEIVWYKHDIIDPFLRERDKFPEREVQFATIDENAGFVDPAFMKSMFASMSREEFLVRTTGMPIEFVGDNLFNMDALMELEKYLRRPEMPQPELGILVYDDKETDDELRMQFIPTVEAFPVEPQDGYIIKIWERPVEKNDMGTAPVYVLAVDPSEGIPGRDYTAAYVTRSDTGDMVAALHGYISELDLARELWKLGLYYSNYDWRRHVEVPAVLVVEVVSIGQATLGYLLHGNSDMNIEKYDDISLYRAPHIDDLKLGLHLPGKDYGWRTTAGHRPYLLTQMRVALQTSIDKIRRGEEPCIRDLGWIYEAKRFVMDAVGKYQAAVGFHDDRLFAKALADIGAKQGVFTIPRHIVPEPPKISDKVIYIDPECYKNPRKAIGFKVDREAAKEQLAKKNDQRKEVAWV